MISNSQLMSAKGSARIAVVGHCGHVTFHFVTSQTYDSNPGPNCSCKPKIICMKNTFFLFCSNKLMLFSLFWHFVVKQQNSPKEVLHKDFWLSKQ